MGEIFDIILRTLFLYVVIMVIFRIMGKREIGELSIIDVVIYIMMAELAVVAIEDPDTPITNSVIPMLLLMMIQVSFALFSLKSKKFRDVMEGKPSVIINNGKIDEKEMKKQRYNLDDLLLQLREKNIRNIADVEYAILEVSGRLSVFEKSKDNSGITLPLILDGAILMENLKAIGKDMGWLKESLQELGYKDIENISLCSFQDGQFFIDLIDRKSN